MKIKSIILSIAHHLLLGATLLTIIVLSVDAVFDQIAVATEPLFYRHEVFFAIFGSLFVVASVLFWYLLKSNRIDTPMSPLSKKETKMIIVKNLLLIFTEGVIVGLLKPKTPHQEE